MQSGIDFEMKVVRLSGVIADPAHSFLFVEENRGEGVDERIVPPRMLHEFSESELTFDRAIEDSAVKSVLITDNGHIVLTQDKKTSFRTKKRR